MKKIGRIASVGVLGLAGLVGGCNATGENDERMLGLMLGVQQYNNRLTPQQQATTGYTGEVIQRYGVAEAGKSTVTQNNYNSGTSTKQMTDAERAVNEIKSSGQTVWR